MRLPRRADYLNKEEVSRSADRTHQLQPVLFMANDVKMLNVCRDHLTQATLAVFGVLECGSRATVLLTDIFPYFYFWAMEDAGMELAIVADALATITPEQYTLETGNHLRDIDRKAFPLAPVAADVEFRKKLMYYRDYSESKIPCVKLAFNTLKQRMLALEYVRSCHYETAEDDSSTNYHRTVLRDHEIQICRWALLRNYLHFPQRSTDRRFKDAIVLILDIADYMDAQSMSASPETRLPKERMITLAWDIETFSPHGSLPMHDDESCRIFMIGMAFYWYTNPVPLVSVCLTDYDIGHHADFLAIYCSDEKGLISMFAQLIERMQPEFIIAFNDSRYDWPWIIERAKRHEILVDVHDRMAHESIFIRTNEDVKRNGIRPHKFKYEANKDMEILLVHPPGHVPIDLMIECRRKFVEVETHGLNSFLKHLKLPAKKDMPIHVMNSSYAACHGRGEAEDAAANTENYRRIAEYCVFDAQSCQHLMVRGNFIITSRAIANLSFISLCEVFYYAGGCKVQNLVMMEGKKRDFLLSRFRAYSEDVAFPGARVVKPTAGLFKPKLSVAERIECQEAWHDMSQEAIDRVYAIVREHGPTLSDAQLNRLGVRDTHVREFFREEIRLPITALDYASLYPSLMMAYNICPSMVVDQETHDPAELLRQGHRLVPIDFELPTGRRVRGLVVWHQNRINTDDADCLFGLFPSILYKLKVARKRLQNEQLNPLGARIEALRKAPDAADPEKLAEMEFEYMMLNSMQLAQKVFMNTFYGESGRSKSPLYMLQVSGGTTQYGRRSLETVIRYLEEQENCAICYGDTDSCYFTLAGNLYAEQCRNYYSGGLQKVAFMRNCVQLTMDSMAQLQARVNDFLYADNGTRFLTMEYEGILYPALFLSKKMYVGVPHVKEINFCAEPKVKGLVAKKRGVSKLHRNVTKELIARLMHVENTYSVWENIQKLIAEVHGNSEATIRDAFDNFTMTAEYRPSVNNICVNRFVERMKAAGVDIMPAERFEYVFIKRDPFTARGTDRDLKKHDFMELAAVAREQNMEIDFSRYFASSIDGQLAAFIANEFTAATEDAKRKMAKKYIMAWRRDHFQQEQIQTKQCRKANFTRFKRLVTDTFLPGSASCILLISGITSDFTQDVMESVEAAAATTAESAGEQFVQAVRQRALSRGSPAQKKEQFQAVKKLYSSRVFEAIYDRSVAVLSKRFAAAAAAFVQWRDELIKTLHPELTGDALFDWLLDESDFVEMQAILANLLVAARARHRTRLIREAFARTEKNIYTN